MTSDHFATRNWLLRTATLPALVLGLGTARVEAADGVSTGYFGNVAIRGYDPVSYFTDGKPTKGSPEIIQTWLGATWYFTSTEHRDTFAAAPVRYAPQYGGFCALSTSFGQVSASIDPEAWRIVDGKLYLFGGKEGIEEDFDSVATAVIARADVKWPEVKRKDVELKQKGN